MSPQGKNCSTLVVSFLGTMCEAAIYTYVGLGLYSQIPMWWCWSFIGAQTLIIIVGRVMAVIGTFYAFRCCFKKKTIKFSELLFITYAGMIRGAIAFALVLRIPYCKTPEDEGCISKVNYDVLVSSTLILVVITTLAFGNFMGKVQSILVPENPEDEEEYVEMKRKESVMVEKELNKRRASSIGERDRAASHYEEITHPNEDRSSSVNEYDPDAPFHWPTSSFVRWFTKFDE